MRAAPPSRRGSQKSDGVRLRRGCSPMKHARCSTIRKPPRTWAPVRSTQRCSASKQLGTDPTPEQEKCCTGRFPASSSRLGSFKGHEGSKISLNTDGGRIAVTTFEKIKIWEVASRALVAAFEVGGAREIALSGDGQRLVYAELGDTPAVSVVDLDEKRTIARIVFPFVPVEFFLRSPWSGSDDKLDWKGPIRITEVSSGR